jgi:protein-disulfide isomerase
MSRVAMFVALLLLLIPALPVSGVAAGQSCEQCLGGAPDAPIKIEVFSDFQCPACRELYMDTMKLVLRDYCSLDKVCVIYREFPLQNHPYSREAARYSIAAQKLGRLQWMAVLDSLYAEQAVWSQKGTVQATVARALSPEDFQKVLKLIQDPSINGTIERDIALGQRRDVQSTPTFFVTALGKEQKAVGFLPYNVLKQYFDRIVK